jgi:hypothetical protein
MVSKKSVDAQLKRIKFNAHSWGKAEIRQLPHILLQDEEIYECVNGTYEGGFALLIATNIRLLLIDKKPLNFLTVEDLRFDMITEIDYNHRMVGAYINVAAGSKNLQFRSYNQTRLRKLISHVQHCMAASKQKQSEHQNDQNSHLEQINQQLQAYLIAQHQQQEELRNQLHHAITSGSSEDTTKLAETKAAVPAIEPVKPSPELSDYLLAQNLLRQYREQQAGQISPVQSEETNNAPLKADTIKAQPKDEQKSNAASSQDLLADAQAEIFGANSHDIQGAPSKPKLSINPHTFKGIEINPLRVAYAKLPMVLRSRKPPYSTLSSPAPIQSQPITN